MAKVSKKSVIDFAAVSSALAGQSECGDRHVVVPLPDGVLVAAIDGLGHGREAAVAAEQAVDAIIRHAATRSLVTLMEQCHADLHGSRGVVMNIARFDAGLATVNWLGVGDVDGRLLNRSSTSQYEMESLLTRSGVVGNRHQLPLLWTSEARVSSGDILIFATDGITREFGDKLNLDEPVDKIAGHIITRYRKVTDDALVLVARYL